MKYLGDVSSVEPWHRVHMECHDCQVSWGGCWDAFQCPKCGKGELPRQATTNMSDLREANAKLANALRTAKPHVVRSIQNDPDALWMRGLPIEPAEAAVRQIDEALRFHELSMKRIQSMDSTEG